MTDIIVIDAGSAGVLAALRASELGARTTLAASGEFDRRMSALAHSGHRFITLCAAIARTADISRLQK